MPYSYQNKPMMMCLCKCLFFTPSLLTIAVDVGAADPCQLEHANGVIDFTSLGRSDGVAAFPNVSPDSASNYSSLTSFPMDPMDANRWFISTIGYSYNPCKPFTNGTEWNVWMSLFVKVSERVFSSHSSIFILSIPSASNDNRFRFALGTQDTAQ